MNYDDYLVKQAMEELRKDDGMMSSPDRFRNHLGVNSLNDSYLKGVSQLNINEYIEAVDQKRQELDKNFKSRSSAGGGNYNKILEDYYQGRKFAGDMTPAQAIEESAVQKLINEKTGDTSHINIARKNKMIMNTIKGVQEGKGNIEIPGLGDPATLDGRLNQADILENRGNKLFNSYQSAQEKLGRIQAPEPAKTTTSPSMLRRIARNLPGKYGKIAGGAAALVGSAGLGAAGNKIVDFFRRGETDEEIIKEIVGEFLSKAKKKDSRLKSAGVSGYNKPKRTPKHPKKSHVVVAKDGTKVKTIRFGEQGASTAGDRKKGESSKMRKKRKSFKARHAKNIKRGKMSAAYWADKVKW